MPPKLLVDPSLLSIDNLLLDQEQVKEWVPQRFEMLQLDGIVYEDPDAKILAGFQAITDDKFWVRGHIPGRPLMPGVMILEACAQLATLWFQRELGDPDVFMGFGGVDHIRFRGTVVPGDLLYLVSQCEKYSPGRGAKFLTQGIVDGRMVFEARVTGVKV
jgi:3-hydroxyacyl-[acyl-carrier-protein] dehydratase